jgi:hypothetical protein
MDTVGESLEGADGVHFHFFVLIRLMLRTTRLATKVAATATKPGTQRGDGGLGVYNLG